MLVITELTMLLDSPGLRDGVIQPGMTVVNKTTGQRLTMSIPQEVHVQLVDLAAGNLVNVSSASISTPIGVDMNIRREAVVESDGKNRAEVAGEIPNDSEPEGMVSLREDNMGELEPPMI